MKKKIVIIGCGFAGVFAAGKLSCLKEDAEITVIDKKETSDFLPMLPDIIGRNIPAGVLTYPIGCLERNRGIDFISEEVKSIDIDKNIVVTGKRTLDYDYLIISSGSETNFYGNDEIKKYAYKLDDVTDARIMLGALEKGNFDTLLVCGGGYTGIEIATSLREYLNKKSLRKSIIIVERAPSLLGPLPEWVKAYAYHNLKKLDIEVLTNTAVDRIQEKDVLLTTGQVFNNVMLIWAAGVRTADFIRNLDAEKNPQGRIKVDEYLRLKNNCFIVGDCAYFSHKSGFLRMAVQFAIYQAISAAYNIKRSIKGKAPVKYRPFDLGYIIPMANNKSCGSVMGLNVTGLPATMMHFTMCVYRSFGLRNKSGVLRNLLKGGAG